MAKLYFLKNFNTFFQSFFLVQKEISGTRNRILLPVSGTTLKNRLSFFHSPNLTLYQNSGMDFCYRYQKSINAGPKIFANKGWKRFPKNFPNFFLNYSVPKFLLYKKFVPKFVSGLQLYYSRKLFLFPVSVSVTGRIVSQPRISTTSRRNTRVSASARRFCGSRSEFGWINIS